MMQKEIAAATHDMQPLASWLVTHHPATPLPETATAQSYTIDPELDTAPRITTIGIGEFGASVARLLSRNLRGIICYEFIPMPSSELGEQVSSVLSSLQKNDLIFIVTVHDDLECAAMAQVVGAKSCGAGVLTIAITAQGEQGTSLPLPVGTIGKWYDSRFAVSGRSMPSQREPFIPEGDALTSYAMRHMVTSITNLITYQTGICIDFADVAAILREGSMGRVGVGVGSGDSRSVVAAKSAIERLEEQGVSLAHVRGVLVSVHGSSTLTMDDFDDASRVIRGSVNDDTNIIVGLISDEQLGYNVKVTVMTTSGSI